MTILKNKDDIRNLRDCGEVIRKLFPVLAGKAVPGVSTAEIDRVAEAMIRDLGAEPAFKGYKGYPATICASVNEVVVHGIPSEETVLEEGDIIGIDVGVRKNGYYTDAARTFIVGGARVAETERLVDVTRRCLEAGIEQAVAGNRVSDISNAVQTLARIENYEEVQAFVGHGIGVNLHEPPEVPNWGEKGRGPVLKEGLLLAIEPMINEGTRNIKVLSDGWTAVTADGKLSAHFENTIMVGREKAEIIT